MYMYACIIMYLTCPYTTPGQVKIGSQIEHYAMECVALPSLKSGRAVDTALQILCCGSLSGAILGFILGGF